MKNKPIQKFKKACAIKHKSKPAPQYKNLLKVKKKGLPQHPTQPTHPGFPEETCRKGILCIMT